MATRQDRPQRNSRRKKSGGAGWLILALLIGGVVAVFVLFPDTLKQFSEQSVPDDLGDQPSITSNAAGDLDDRDTRDLPSRSVDVDAGPLDTTKAADQNTDAAPVATAAAANGADDSKAGPILDQADEAYRSYDWDSTRSLLRKVSTMQLSSELAVRADDLKRGADALEDLFDRLDTKNEMQRNIETHPLLVMIDYRGDEQLVLPIVDMHSKEPPNTKDPVTWVNQQLSGVGKITVRGLSGVAFVANADDIGDVAAANYDRILGEKRSEFDIRLRRLENGSLKRDALAWYEAAKFAYRNRLDKLVTEMLDRALALDPLLTSTIKDDLASDIYLKMVQLMDNGNKAGAASWKVKLDRDFKDTSIYEEAAAYYLGNIAQIRAAREQAAAKRRAQREEAMAQRRERAEALGDEQELAAIEEEAEVEDSMTGAVEIAATGDVAEANAYYNRGIELLTKAQNMAVTPERDQIYAKAEKEFSAAMAIYEKLGMEAELVQANQYRYACIKYRRF